MNNISDEELIIKYKSGCAGCIDQLILRYLSLIRAKAKNYFLVGGERQDLVQEGLLGLFKAIRDYDPQKNTQFKAFAVLCITRQLASALKKSNRHKNQPLNTYISLYQDYNGELEIKDVLECEGQSPEQILIDKESASAFIGAVKQRLTPLERKVFCKYIRGLSYVQIASELSVSNKSIDNALQRIKRKLLKCGEIAE